MTAVDGPSPWLDGDATPTARMAGEVRADVVVVGAGFTGLWTALELTERAPDLGVVVLEAEHVGHGGSGRNGGFVDPSLTHGLANGVAHLPDEVDALVRLGRENLDGLVAFVRDQGIDADLRMVGSIEVANATWHLDELAASAELHRQHGLDVELLDATAVRAELDSPTYLGGLRHRDGALVDPGALVRGLARVAIARGVTLHEGSAVRSIATRGDGVRVRTDGGTVDARHLVLAVNAWSRGLHRAAGRRFVPVYDHVLLTEPLTPEQLDRIGWRGRQGFSDVGNRFHYYRLTRDDRILWGGYDAIHRFGSPVDPRLDHHAPTFALLERNLRWTFPQLADVGIARRWGGPIATTTDFMPVFPTLLGGRGVAAFGYTGLGVAASRFAARVLVDRLVEPDSPLLRLAYVRRRPFPFPPEPLRSIAVGTTRRALIRADRREGRRGPWLRLLDAVGVGFDS